jgi:hypothetical protein
MPVPVKKPFDFRDGFSTGAISSSIQVDFSERIGGSAATSIKLHITYHFISISKSCCKDLILMFWDKSHGFQDTRLSFQEQLLKDINTAAIKLPGMFSNKSYTIIFSHSPKRWLLTYCHMSDASRQQIAK